MINNINTLGQRPVSFGNSQPTKRREPEFDLSNGVNNDAEAVSVLGAAAVGGFTAKNFVKSELAQKAGKCLVTFGEGLVKHSKHAGNVALKVGKGSYNILKETGEVLVKVVPSLFIKFIK